MPLVPPVLPIPLVTPPIDALVVGPVELEKLPQSSSPETVAIGFGADDVAVTDGAAVLLERSAQGSSICKGTVFVVVAIEEAVLVGGLLAGVDQVLKLNAEAVVGAAVCTAG